MSSCKNKDCDSCEKDGDSICPFCGYCAMCHMDSDLEGSCASNLVTQKTDHFKFRTTGDVPTYECNRCRTYKFIVGYTDSYETSIKCSKCGFERIIHDG